MDETMMADDRNNGLPDDVALGFGRDLMKLAGVTEENDAIALSLGRYAFAQALKIAEQVDFGEDVG